MSEKTENQSNALDMFKWVVVFALLAGLVTANTMYGEISVLYRAIAIVVVVGIAGFIAATTEKGSTFLSFAKDYGTNFMGTRRHHRSCSWLYYRNRSITVCLNKKQ